jgi:putative ABC transport system permease protein
MNGMVQDLRYGLRMLGRSPGLTVSAILTLALGIGANTSIFSVVDAVVLRPLPYPGAGTLVSVHQSWASSPGAHDVLSTDDVVALREGARALGPVAAYFSPVGGFAITGLGDPERVYGTAATEDLFDVLGVRPILGRGFVAEDGKPGAAPVVVLSHALWQRRFGGDPAIIGRSIGVNDRSHTIVGVMPQGFGFPYPRVADLWPIFRPERSDSRPPFYVRTVARLRPGVDPAEIRDELQAITAHIQARFPESPSDWRLGQAPLKEELTGDVRPALLILLGAVALVLLIATANIANLLLARATARRKEMAIRASLGAGRARLVRQLLTESLLLAGIGGLLGSLLSLWGTDLLVRIGPGSLPRMNEVGVDSRVLSFTLVVTVLCGIAFGLAPALQASRSRLTPGLHDGGRGTTDRGGRRIRSLLVVSEFTLAVMLLVGAGLLIRSFIRLQQVSPGFEAGEILTASISLPESRYADGPARSAFFRSLLERTGTLPGVEATAISMALPPNLLVMTNPFTIEGRPLPPGQHAPAIEQLLISPDYFRALGIPVLRGRPFDATDAGSAPLVVVINQTMATTVFPGEEAIGKRLQLGDPDPRSPWVTIVGVVGDVKYTGLDAVPAPTMYTPYEQDSWWPTMYLIVRSTGRSAGLAQAVRAEAAALDPQLPVAEVRTMRDLLGRSVAEPLFRTALLGIFALVALILAALGIYGILSYAVGQRTQEIGIRMALGARPGDVVALILRDGMALVGAGVGLGLVAALALSRLLTGLLFGVGPMDAWTFGLASLAMAVAAFLACYLPASRAARVDPMVALRAE